MSGIFRHEFRHGLLWNYVDKIGTYAINFLLTIIVARGLGSHEFGSYSEVFAFATLLWIACSLGLETTLNIYIPKYLSEPNKISYLIRKSFLVITFFSSFLYLIFLAIGQNLFELLNNSEIFGYFNLIFLYVFFHNLVVLSEFIFQAFYRTKLLAFVNISIKLLLITAVAVGLFLNNAGLTEVILLYALGDIAIAMVRGIFLFKYFRPKPEKFSVIPLFKSGLSIWITKFLNLLLGRYLDIILLGYFLIDKIQIGHYNIAFMLVTALMYLVTSGFGGVSVSAFSEMERNNEITNIGVGWSKITQKLLFLLIPLFVFSIFKADAIITISFGNDFLESANLFRVFASLFLLSLLIGSGMNSAALYALKKEGLVLKLRVFAGILNFILDIVLIPLFGALGALVATGFSTTMIVGLELFFLARLVSLKYPIVYVLKLLISSLLGLVICYNVGTIGFVNLIVQGGLFVTTYVVTTSLFKISIIPNIQDGLLQYIRAAGRSS